MAARGIHPVRLELTPEERAIRERWTRRGSTAQALASRARIVLACADRPGESHGARGGTGRAPRDRRRLAQALRGLPGRALAGAAFASTDALEAALRAYIAATNAAPRPFIWTKTADEILESIARYCNRINESRH